MKIHVFVVKHVLVRPAEMFELMGQAYLKKEPQPASRYFPGHLFLWKILLSGPYNNHVNESIKFTSN